MSSKLGSRLAQLAKDKKTAEVGLTLSKEDVDRLDAEAIATNLNRIQLILLPHVEEFNQAMESSLHIALEVTAPCVRIKQNRLSLLTLEITAQAAVFKRRSGEYSSEDYFTIGTDGQDGSMTFRNYSADVAKPLVSNQFAELVLMEALGLNQ